MTVSKRSSTKAPSSTPSGAKAPRIRRAKKPRGAQDFLTGKLLIATPGMTDPRFERSILLVCAHDERHAMAVIVNKPVADIELSDLLEQLDIDPREGVGGDPVHFGGPVDAQRGAVIHSLDYRSEATIDITPFIGLTASRDALVDIGGLKRLRPPPAQFILAIGHAGWGPGQLEAELSANAWAYCDADPALVFTSDPASSWTGALAKLGVTAAMFSAAWSQTRRGDSPLN